MDKIEIKNNTQITVYILNDAEIKALNKEFRQKDYPTDVLSFEIKETMPDGSYYLGDIVINKDQALRQMKEYGNDDVRFEIAELAAHGVLHLLGIDHDEKGHYMIDGKDELAKKPKEKNHNDQCPCGGNCGCS